MSDYYPLLSRMVAGLDSSTGEARRALYGRARAVLCEQLRTHAPPLPDSEITRERLSLEAAIRKFEADTIRRPRDAAAHEPGAAAPGEEVGSGRPEVPPPSATGSDTLQIRTAGQQPDPVRREQLVELVLSAQKVEAKPQQTAGAPAAAPNGDLLGAAAQSGPASMPQRVRPPRHARPSAAVPDLLTKLIDARQDVRPDNNSNPSSPLGRRSLQDGTSAGDFLTPLLGSLYFVLGFVQLVAFFHGLQAGFGLGGVASIGIFMLLYLAGSAGSIPMAVVAFYGAWRGWQWSMVAAALLTFPFVVLSFGFLGVGGFYNFFNRKKAAPLVRAIRSRLESPWWRERARRWRGALPRLGWTRPGRPVAGVRRPRSRR